MRFVAALLFVGALFAVSSQSSAQPPRGGQPGQPGQPGGKGGFQGGKGGAGGFGGMAQPGQILPSFLQEVLKLTEDQKKQVADLQKDLDAKLAKILTEDQKKQLTEMRERGAGGKGGAGGFPGGKGGFPGGKGGEKGGFPKKD